MKYKGKEVTEKGYDLHRKMGKDHKTYSEYLDEIDIYLNVAKDKTVLEIGPHHFQMTKRIVSHNPTSVLTIEPDINCNVPDGLDAENYRGTADDYFNEFDTKFDVIFCCGVLYHLHSPLHLIEQICNNRPETLIVETTYMPTYNEFGHAPNIQDFVKWGPREKVLNVCIGKEWSVADSSRRGGAQLSKGIKKQIPYNTLYPNDVIEDIIKGFGYKVIKKKQVMTNYRSKAHVAIWHFELDPSVTDEEWTGEPDWNNMLMGVRIPTE
jgi:hypothetical protein